MTNAITQAAFAEQEGWHRSYVTKLKQAGRLVMSDDGKKVLVKESLAKIAETEDPNRDDVKNRHAAKRGNADQGADVVVKFSDGRAKEQHYKALRSEAEYKEMVGELVRAEDVKQAVADIVITFRQSLENLPHRLAPDLVGKDVDFVRSKLREETFNVLSQLQKKLNEKMEGRKDA